MLAPGMPPALTAGGVPLWLFSDSCKCRCLAAPLPLLGSASLVGPRPSQICFPTVGGWRMQSASSSSWQADRNEALALGGSLWRRTSVVPRPHGAQCFYDFFLESCLPNRNEQANPKRKPWP